MTPLAPETLVAALVTERPARGRVFEQLGIDYCCGGKRSLASACAEKGLDVAAVLDALRAADDAGDEGEKVEGVACGVSASTSSPSTTPTCGASCRASSG